jgi:hypothetical protein
MSKSVLKSIAATTLPVAVAAIVSQACTSSTSAQSDGNKDPIEGLWNSHVTLSDCQTGAVTRQFSAMNLFIRGGTLTDTDMQPPASHGPAFGTWQNSGTMQYTSMFQFFRFNADGSFAGTNKVTRTITLSADSNAFTSTITVDVDDPAGASVGSACGSESATRAQ